MPDRWTQDSGDQPVWWHLRAVLDFAVSCLLLPCWRVFAVMKSYLGEDETFSVSTRWRFRLQAARARFSLLRQREPVRAARLVM